MNPINCMLGINSESNNDKHAAMQATFSLEQSVTLFIKHKHLTNKTYQIRSREKGDKNLKSPPKNLPDLKSNLDQVKKPNGKNVITYLNVIT